MADAPVHSAAQTAAAEELALHRQVRRQRWRRSLFPAIALVILAMIVTAAVAAPLISPHPPSGGYILDNFQPPLSESFGGALFVLGTDAAGNDILSRALFGARVSLIVGVASVAGAALIGTLIGLIAGFYRGWVDEIVMRLVDIQMAFPFILLAIIIMFIVGQGLGNVVIVLIVTGWPMYARVARAEALRMMDSDFILAARTIGVSHVSIMLRHLLPNMMTPLIVLATAAVPQMIILEAALSFLGVGVPPDVPSWGGMLASGRAYLEQAWWVATFPGLGIIFTVLSINILGDWLRDRLDPHLSNN